MTQHKFRVPQEVAALTSALCQACDETAVIATDIIDLAGQCQRDAEQIAALQAALRDAEVLPLALFSL